MKNDRNQTLKKEITKIKPSKQRKQRDLKKKFGLKNT